MLNKFTKGRVFVAIDAANIYHSQKTLKWRIDFKRLLDYLRKEVNLVKISFYTAQDPNHKKQKLFLDFLDIIGYTVRSKKVKFIKDKDTTTKHGGHRKGNLDVEITMDALNCIDNYDSFVLFSGDSDFEPLIEQLKLNHKRCIVLSSRGHISIELLQQAKYINLKKLKKQIAME